MFELLLNIIVICHAPMQSGHSDSTPVISDCFRAFSLLVEHLPAPGLAPLHYITLWTVLLHSLYVYIPLYIVSSSLVCGSTRLLVPFLTSSSQIHSASSLSILEDLAGCSSRPCAYIQAVPTLLAIPHQFPPVPPGWTQIC